MEEGTVEFIRYDGVWCEIKLREFDKPIMVHKNWFIVRNDEENKNLVKVGDKVRFEITKPVYLNDTEHIYVKNFNVVKGTIGGVSLGSGDH